ncbi:MAG: flagellar hook capping FlgD N-terminal domain-containing protein [Anaeromyxobacter sp.]
MSISAIGSTTTTASNSLSMQDFLKVLLTQLSYQDPLKPMDNEQFMAQMAQFTTLQQTQELNTKLTQLLTNQASLQSVGLIGRTVDLTTASGPMTGTVTGLVLSGQSPQVSVRTSTGEVLSNIELSQNHRRPLSPFNRATGSPG